jgi:hypothetical protein
MVGLTCHFLVISGNPTVVDSVPAEIMTPEIDASQQQASNDMVEMRFFFATSTSTVTNGFGSTLTTYQ